MVTNIPGVVSRVPQQPCCHYQQLYIFSPAQKGRPQLCGPTPALGRVPFYARTQCHTCLTRCPQWDTLTGPGLLCGPDFSHRAFGSDDTAGLRWGQAKRLYSFWCLPPGDRFLPFLRVFSNWVQSIKCPVTTFPSSSTMLMVYIDSGCPDNKSPMKPL